MKDEGEKCGSKDKELDTEGIVYAIVRVLVTFVDEVNGVGRRGEKENLHDGVVESEGRVPGFSKEEIEISSGEDNHVEDLSL